MKKLLVVIMILAFAASFALAQEDYSKLDAGLRGGVRPGITGRYFLSESKNIEALIAFRGSGLILTGMYQWQKPLSIGEVEELSWYFGGGLHLGYWSAGSLWGSDLALGLDLIAGVEYDLEPLINFPLSASLDYKPAFDIFGGWAGSFGDVAISLRYAF